MPFLIGKTYYQAHKILHALSLNIGTETYMDSRDTAEVKVYMQKPGITSKTPLNLGEPVSLWYKSFKTFDFNKYVDKLKKDSLPN